MRNPHPQPKKIALMSAKEAMNRVEKEGGTRDKRIEDVMEKLAEAVVTATNALRYSVQIQYEDNDRIRLTPDITRKVKELGYRCEVANIDKQIISHRELYDSRVGMIKKAEPRYQYTVILTVSW